MSTPKRLLAISAAVLLTACASMAPPYERPAAPVQAAYPGAAAADADAAAPRAPALDWHTFAADPGLQRLVDLALANNRDLRVAALSVERARAQFDIQRADRLPTVNAAASLQRQPNSQGEQTSTYTVGLAVPAFELDLFGRVRSLGDAALASYLASDEGRRTVQAGLVGAVLRGRLALQADDELIDLTQRTLDTRRASLDLTQLRFDHGAASELDVQQARTLIEAARATLAQLQRQRQLDENALVLLLGAPLPADLAPLPALAALELGRELGAGLPSELLDNRPDIRQAEHTLRSAQASIGAARAAFFPRITLTGSAGIASSSLSDLFQGGHGAWTFGPQVTLPIFDAGRNRANLAVSTVNRDVAVAQYDKAVQTAFREVADALAGRTRLGEQEQALRAQAEAESARLRLSDLRYRNGVASFLDLLDSQRSLFAVQQSIVQVRLARLQNQVSLYQALGGGAPAASP